MKRMLIAGAFALTAGMLTAGTQAFAADLPPAPPPPRAPAAYIPTIAPVYNWSGFYFGVNGGYGFGSSTWSVAGGSTGNFNIPGFLVGGTFGGNFQAGAFVFGVETDLDYSTIQGTVTNATCPVGCQTSNNWLGTTRARVGIAADRVLFFATGGAAYGDIQAHLTGAGTNTSTEFGWTAGGGIEAAFAHNWTAKVEYLYVDLNNGSCSTGCGFVAGGTSIAVSLKESLVRLGVNYKF